MREMLIAFERLMGLTLVAGAVEMMILATEP